MLYTDVVKDVVPEAGVVAWEVPVVDELVAGVVTGTDESDTGKLDGYGLVIVDVVWAVV